MERQVIHAFSADGEVREITAGPGVLLTNLKCWASLNRCRGVISANCCILFVAAVVS